MPNYNISIPRDLNALLIDEVSERKRKGDIVSPEAIIRNLVVEHFNFNKS